jgi:hypothetical protein
LASSPGIAAHDTVELHVDRARSDIAVAVSAAEDHVSEDTPDPVK